MLLYPEFSGHMRVSLVRLLFQPRAHAVRRFERLSSRLDLRHIVLL
jgi:hypothetical protein